MNEPYIGGIVLFAGNFAPRGWALCNGQLLSISQNTALFSILGTTYGGDGVQTFALPNLQGRVAIHPGNGAGLSPYVLGQTAGNESVTLLTTQIPSHNHLVNGTGAAPARGGANPIGNYPAAVTVASGAVPDIYASTAPTGTMNGNMITLTGGNQPHSNIQPYQCVNYIIALQGIFPSRN
jgi:microcystin-dependent protein